VVECWYRCRELSLAGWWSIAIEFEGGVPWNISDVVVSNVH